MQIATRNLAGERNLTKGYKMHFVYSTLSNDHTYTNWKLNSDPRIKPERIPGSVKIKGGANIATPAERNHGIHTPRGVVTAVNDDQMVYLSQNKVFQKHIKKGFLLVAESEANPNKVAKENMEAADKSAPLTPTSEVFQDEDAPKPITEKEKTSAVHGIVSRVKSAITGGD